MTVLYIPIFSVSGSRHDDQHSSQIA